MILQTGMRTDIPAFYSEWFRNRVKDGFVLVRNPYNPGLLTRYEINPDVVDMITFCTKDPSPMLSELPMLKPYGQYWFVTITPYGKDTELNVPDWETVAESFISLSKNVGINSIGWRYDPVFISGKYTADFHLEMFDRIACKLENHTQTCVISFIDIYQKVRKNFPEAEPVSRSERMLLVQKMIKIAGKHGMSLKTCGEGNELEPYGADCSGCMTQAVYEKALGNKLIIPKHKSYRKQCGCFLGNDIGAYNTCMHFCRYCYANYDKKTVIENRRRHDPESPLLVGWPEADEQIHLAGQEKWSDGQMVFDFHMS